MTEEAHAARSSNRVTIRDVAEIARVSTATVSYVVNNAGGVSLATMARVRVAICLLNWSPDPSAQRLASQNQRSRKV
jgi:DNA-binding LacI/PurR family transcriptional regulator